MDRAQEIGDNLYTWRSVRSPKGQGGVQGCISDIVLKWIVAGPEINRLHEFEGVQGKWKLVNLSAELHLFKIPIFLVEQLKKSCVNQI